MTLSSSLQNIFDQINSLDVSSADQVKLLYWKSVIHNLDCLIVEQTWYEENE